MKVTIVTPSYNQAKFIKDCINSVRNQTYRPIEHIIVDNCSPDGTREILEEYKRNRNGIEVKIIIEPDKGQTDALNKGFKRATGDIIGWLNADDYFLPNVINKVIKSYEKYPMTDVVYGDYYFVDATGNIIKKRREINYDPKILFYVGCYIPSTGSFFHRRIFDEGYLLNTDFDITMDYEFFVKLSKEKKKFMHIPEYFFYFRWHQENKSLDAIKRRIERYKVQQIYGIKIFKKPGWNQNIYNILFYTYLAKRVFKKLINRCYF